MKAQFTISFAVGLTGSMLFILFWDRDRPLNPLPDSAFEPWPEFPEAAIVESNEFVPLAQETVP